jgi:hypothetical protein
MNRAVAVSAYRLILRLHPAPFAARFGDEMLWIFEEECERGTAARLFFDGVLSLLRQRFRVQEEPVQAPARFGLLVPDSISAPRLLQATLMASLFFAGFLLLLHPGRGPLPGSSLAPCALCSGHAQATPEIVTLPQNLR